MRRRPDPRQTRGLGDLLAAQSVSFRKHTLYPRLAARLAAVPALTAVRLDRRALAVLNRARIRPENLENLYRSCRLSADEFFPLFLRIKTELQEKRRERARLRSLEIARLVNALPPNVHDFIVLLARIEGRFDSGCPVWLENLYPKTKKRARELSGFTFAEWIAYFGWYLDLLRARYAWAPDLRALEPRLLMACMVLGCMPDPATLRLPPPARIKERYRLLSKQAHPDAGGDPGLFRMISLARDTLLEQRPRSGSP